MEKDTKVSLITDLNKAYESILSICSKLHLKVSAEKAYKDRRFITRMIELSDFPEC